MSECGIIIVLFTTWWERMFPIWQKQFLFNDRKVWELGRIRLKKDREKEYFKSTYEEVLKFEAGLLIPSMILDESFISFDFHYPIVSGTGSG